LRITELVISLQFKSSPFRGLGGLVNLPSFGRKTGSTWSLCGGKGLLDFAEAGATAREGAKDKQPVVLPDFAAMAPCEKKQAGGDLNFCFFCFKTKEVAAPAMRRLRK
jgi:hypothetical protein